MKRPIYIEKYGNLWYPILKTNNRVSVMGGYFGYRDKEQLIKDVEHTLWFLGASLMYEIVVK